MRPVPSNALCNHKGSIKETAHKLLQNKNTSLIYAFKPVVNNGNQNGTDSTNEL